MVVVKVRNRRMQIADGEKNDVLDDYNHHLTYNQEHFLDFNNFTESLKASDEVTKKGKSDST